MAVVTSSEEPDPPRKGRGNAILTYETVGNIEATLALVNAKLDRLDEKFDENAKTVNDHEVRLRVLEKSDNERNGKSGFATWAAPILISVSMLVMAVLNYIK